MSEAQSAGLGPAPRLFAPPLHLRSLEASLGGRGRRRGRRGRASAPRLLGTVSCLSVGVPCPGSHGNRGRNQISGSKSTLPSFDITLVHPDLRLEREP